MHRHPRPLETRRKRKLLFFEVFWVPLAGEPAAEQNKKETKDYPPGPPSGEGVVRSLSPEEQIPEAPGHPSQERHLPWCFPSLAGAEMGCAAFLLTAPRCGRCEGCC